MRRVPDYGDPEGTGRGHQYFCQIKDMCSSSRAPMRPGLLIQRSTANALRSFPVRLHDPPSQLLHSSLCRAHAMLDLGQPGQDVLNGV